MIIVRGLAADHRDAAAALYWEAFGAKLGRLLGPRDKALRFVALVMRPDHALCAVGGDGRLLGVAGFKTRDGAFVSGGFGDLCKVYGFIGASWRAFLMSALVRDTENRRFLMDGLFVAPEARCRGVGTALLEGICAEAAQRGYREVRLDVIDTNPRARALYVRVGFRDLKTIPLGALRAVVGFRTSTAMVREVCDSACPK